jgi:hypothetical protein
MSLSYRKARTAPSSLARQTAYRTTGAARGTAYRVAGTGRTFQRGTAGTGKSESPGTVGTSALQPEVVFVGHNDQVAKISSAPYRMRQGNVVELFPGATSTPAANRGNWLGRLRYAEAGMATAEYAIATLAAVGFAGLLVVILRSDEVRGFLMTIIQQALTLG